MNISTKHLSRLWLMLVAAGAGLLASEMRADPAGSKPEPSRFALAPRSMQEDPLLEITAMTEVTDAGKKLPKVTKDRPAYYLAHSEGFKELGEGFPSGSTLGEEDMGRFMRNSLAGDGYLEAGAAGRPPTLVILYGWGLYSTQIDNGPDAGEQATNGQASSDSVQAMHEAYDRAALVGGSELAQKMQAMMRWRGSTGHERNMKPTSNIADPMYEYSLEGHNHAFLMGMVKSDLYYVVVSAYDYQAYRQHRSVLLWRTRMAISSSGLSQPQVLPTMVLAGSGHFGKESHGDPDIIRRHAAGHVEVGEVKVVSFGTPTAAPASSLPSAAPAPAVPAPAAPSPK